MHEDERCAQIGRDDVTSCMLGIFRTQAETRQEFLSAINLKGAS
jgi:GTP cyclohydrolase I